MPDGDQRRGDCRQRTHFSVLVWCADRGRYRSRRLVEERGAARRCGYTRVLFAGGWGRSLRGRSGEGFPTTERRTCMKAIRRTAAVLAISMLAVLGLSTPALAITGGEPDGNRHPNVGLILFYAPDGRFRCSATLISPTVLSTATHCTVDTVGKTLVTFDPVIAEHPPSPFPVAANPAAGYTAAEITSAGYRSGTAYTHPAYSNFTD